MKHAVAMLSAVLLWQGQVWAQDARSTSTSGAAQPAAREGKAPVAARSVAAGKTEKDRKDNEKKAGQVGTSGAAVGSVTAPATQATDAPSPRAAVPAQGAAPGRPSGAGREAAGRAGSMGHRGDGDAAKRERMRRMRRMMRHHRLGRGRMWSRRHPFGMRRGPYSIVFIGQLQVQGVLYVGKDALYENGDPASDEGLLIRRARLGVFGSLPWDFHYELEIEAVSDLQRGSSGDGLAGQFIGAQLLDASISWRRWRALEVGVGARKVPGARGRMVSSKALQLVERSIAIEKLVIDRRPGLWIKGDLRWFKYDLGFFNADKGLNFGNEGGGYMSAARLEVAPLGPMGDSVSDALKPFQRMYHKVRFGLGTSFQYAHGPATDRMTASADLGLKWHGLSILAEAIYNWEKPKESPTVPSALPEVIEGLGAYGQVGYFILPGRLEAAVRFEYLDPNRNVDSADDIWALTGGVNFFWTRYLRAQLSYTHKQEVHHAQVDNDALLVQMQAAF